MTRLRSSFAALAAPLLLLATAGAAQAAPAQAAPGGKGAGGESCVTVLAPLQKGQTASDVVYSGCGDAATVQRNLAAYSTLIGIEYDNYSFGGTAWAVYGNGGSCSAGATYGFPTLGWWNERIRSARTYNGCRSRHYDGEYYTGGSIVCGCANMGWMTNRASSIVFSRYP